MKKQVVVIHGGDVHNSYKEYLSDLKKYKVYREDMASGPTSQGWRQNLYKELGKDYEVFTPEMPNWVSAKYVEWKIWFDKIFQFLDKGPVFVGHSLGAIFLSKYFSENDDAKKAAAVFLIAAPYRDSDSKDQLADFVLPKDLKRLKKLGSRLHLYYSTDDPVVSIKALREHKKRLPNAQIRVFKDKGHFRMPRFPELVKDIKNLYKS